MHFTDSMSIYRKLHRPLITIIRHPAQDFEISELRIMKKKIYLI
jgi:hypothetical protein